MSIIYTETKSDKDSRTEIDIGDGRTLTIQITGEGIIMDVWPMSGYGLSDDPDRLGIQRRMARALNLPVIWGTCGNLDGRSLSVARDAGVPAIYTEYLGSGRCSPDGTDAYFEGCLNVMAEFGMLQHEQPDALGPGRPVRRLGERLAPAVGRQRALPAELDEGRRRGHHGRAPGQREVALPAAQRRGGQV